MRARKECNRDPHFGDVRSAPRIHGRNATARCMYTMRMIPAFAAIQKAVTEHILADANETTIERIYLIGSAQNQERFRPGQSDVDLVVLYSGQPPRYGALFREINEAFLGPWTSIEIVFRSLEDVSKMSSYELAFEARILAGQLLFNADNQHHFEPLLRDAAKALVIRHYIMTAARWHSLARFYADRQYRQHTATWESCCAACRALHAVITRHDIDFAPKSVRWELMPLLDIAVSHEPLLASIQSHVVALPQDLARMTIDEVDDLEHAALYGNPVPPVPDVDDVISHSREIINACYGVLKGSGAAVGCSGGASVILFLDYDGVLHGEAVWLDANNKPYLDERYDHQLFAWAPLLEQALAPYPDLEIILSTTWVFRLGFDVAKSYLPAAIRDRVVDHTCTHPWRFSRATRYEQIRGYVARNHLERWLAIDDDESIRLFGADENIVVTPSNRGLSAPGILDELKQKLAWLHGAGEPLNSGETND